MTWYLMARYGRGSISNAGQQKMKINWIHSQFILRRPPPLRYLFTSPLRASPLKHFPFFKKLEGFTRDWFGFYWHRLKLEKGAALLVIDLGSHAVKSATIPKDSATPEVLPAKLGDSIINNIYIFTL